MKATSAQLSCPGYNPRSTAVTTGRAAARFTATGIRLDHTVAVLARSGMLAPFWKATYSAGFLPCLRSAFFLQMPPNVAVASANKVTFPKYGKYTSAYRIVYETPVANGKSVVGVYDLIAIGNERTQIVLMFKAGLGHCRTGGREPEGARGGRGEDRLRRREARVQLAGATASRARSPRAGEAGARPPACP